MSGPLPEEELIRAYRETIRPLYASVSRRVGGDLSLAEDLVQETWMRALDAWPRKGIPNEPLAWLLRVARNTLVSHFRRFRPEPIDPASIELEAETLSRAAPEAAAVIGWGLARLRRAHADILEAFNRANEGGSRSGTRSPPDRAAPGGSLIVRSVDGDRESALRTYTRVRQVGALPDFT